MTIRMLLAAAALAVGAWAGSARADGPVYYESWGGSGMGSWHAGYAESGWKRPVPLVVPPTAMYQSDYAWGIGGLRVSGIYPQFMGPMDGYPYEGPNQWQPTPYWTTDTLQFGVYYIRGPW